MADITISYKGNTIAEVSASGTTTLGTSGKYCEDDISIAYTKPSGGVSQPSNDVNFIDYDGTIVASYSAADFANLSAMPDNPTHTGLTAQGWNWTLADAKAQVSVSGQLVIGQMYVTSDGKTRIYLSIPNELLCEVKLNWGQTVANGVTIDWGDGTATETFSGTGSKNQYHTYASVGDYCITLNPTSGTLTLGGGGGTSTLIYGRTNPQGLRNILKRVEVGRNTEFAASCFYCSYLLEYVTIPKEITTIPNLLLYNTYMLKSLVIPHGVSSITTNTFRLSYALEWLSIPKSLTTFGNYCFNGALLRSFTIPLATTAIPDSLLNADKALVKIVIPSSVTSIGTQSFYSCESLQEIHFKPTTPPTVANANAFQSVPTTCKIYVPSGSLSAYTSANNYPSSSTYTYIEE